MAKVEELLALCDELEARQAVVREHRTRLVRSALGHLTDANGARVCDPRHVARKTASEKRSNISLPSGRCGSQSRAPQEDFHQHAAFVLREFPQLTAAPEDVPALRQAILSLAVQGRGGLATVPRAEPRWCLERNRHHRISPARRVEISWRAAIGPGFSSPVVADGRVFVTDSRVARPKARERVLCFDLKTGKNLWTHSYS